jgi:hypothetical protein
MNLRIKELLSQPGLERLNDWVSIGPVQKVALEDFVELIVRDCAGQDDREGWIGTHSPECWSFGPRHYECAIRRIKELEK